MKNSIFRYPSNTKKRFKDLKTKPAFYWENLNFKTISATSGSTSEPFYFIRGENLDEHFHLKMQFFMIALVFNQKNQILVVKKEIPRRFLELCGIDYNPGPIWFAPSGNQIKDETREEPVERIVLKGKCFKN
jgi:hypothetical protein